MLSCSPAGPAAVEQSSDKSQYLLGVYAVPGTVLSILHESMQQLYEKVWYFFIPNLQMRKVEHREVN